MCSLQCCVHACTFVAAHAIARTPSPARATLAPPTCCPDLAGCMAPSSWPSRRPSRIVNSCCSTSRLSRLAALGEGRQGERILAKAGRGDERQGERKMGGRAARRSWWVPGLEGASCRGMSDVHMGHICKPGRPLHRMAHAPAVTGGGRCCAAARRARTAGVCTEAVSSFATAEGHDAMQTIVEASAAVRRASDRLLRAQTTPCTAGTACRQQQSWRASRAARWLEPPQASSSAHPSGTTRGCRPQQ